MVHARATGKSPSKFERSSKVEPIVFRASANYPSLFHKDKKSNPPDSERTCGFLTSLRAYFLRNIRIMKRGVMARIEKILAPTDFSDVSKRGVRRSPP